jgi:hypothetical protein
MFNVLPENVQDELWKISGNYCCVECAAADSFDRDDAGVWHRYGLLNNYII